MLLRIAIILGFFLLVELYAFQIIRTLFKTSWIQSVYLILSTIFIVFFIWSFSKFDRSVGQTNFSLLITGIFLLVYVPKFIFSFLMFTEDVFRLIMTSFSWVSNNFSQFNLPNRWVPLSKFGAFLGILVVLMLSYGMLFGKYNFKVFKNHLVFNDLPQAFDGLKILHLSDIHIGSLKEEAKIIEAINLINQQDFDLVLFTGDVVNSLANEFDPWIEVFKAIKTPKYGKFSVLGNHDYGEYIDWKGNDIAKQKNFEDIKNIHQKIGFKLLLNEHIKLSNQTDTIVIVGVENWGKNFKKAGDLSLAIDGLNNSSFKILLSHDPSHWEYEVKNHPQNIQLTLSGHTHGMQFGLEINDFLKWSPVQYVYKQWAGVYQHQNKILYVNRGFGFHAYPGRFGIWPEIGIISLNRP